ncbi:hypothetical protein HK405_002373 [Cladochytrium tenue]|nr:hypothetical protein HK405_002373 [Cladochytrium tenue]
MRPSSGVICENFDRFFPALSMPKGWAARIISEGSGSPLSPVPSRRTTASTTRSGLSKGENTVEELEDTGVEAPRRNRLRPSSVSANVAAEWRQKVTVLGRSGGLFVTAQDTGLTSEERRLARHRSIRSWELQPLVSPIEGPGVESDAVFSEGIYVTTESGTNSFGQPSASSDKTAVNATNAVERRVTWNEYYLKPFAPPPEPNSRVSVIGLDSTATPRHVQWHRGRIIGRGSYARVYFGLNVNTMDIMAVKQVELVPSNQSAESGRLRKKMVDALNVEVRLLRELDHPNVVRYLGFDIQENVVSLFLQYVDGGSIASMLSLYGPFELHIAQLFVRQVVDGLQYLHDRFIIHRDIKGANLLVDREGTVRIADFGISKKNEYSTPYKYNARMSLQGSVFWMAPEVLKGRGYSAKVDIWSLGCVTLEMLTGTHPWKGFGETQTMWRLGKDNAPPLPTMLDERARNFIETCCTVNPEERPTAEALLDCEFVACELEGCDFGEWLESVEAQAAAERALEEDESETEDDDDDDDDEEEEEGEAELDDDVEGLVGPDGEEADRTMVAADCGGKQMKEHAKSACAQDAKYNLHIRTDMSAQAFADVVRTAGVRIVAAPAPANAPLHFHIESEPTALRRRLAHELRRPGSADDAVNGFARFVLDCNDGDWARLLDAPAAGTAKGAAKAVAAVTPLGVLRSCLLPLKTEGAAGGRYTSVNTFARLLLSVEPIQAGIATFLLQRIPDYQFEAEDGDSDVCRLLLQQFKYLDYIVDGDSVVRSMLDILDATTASPKVQKELITSMPEIVPDHLQNEIVTHLQNRLDDNSELVAVVLDALSTMSVPPESLKIDHIMKTKIKENCITPSLITTTIRNQIETLNPLLQSTECFEVGNLTEIAQVQSMGIVMFEKEKLKSLRSFEASEACSALLYAINYFRELVNAFSKNILLDKTFSITHCVQRVENLVELLRMLEGTMQLAPDWIPLDFIAQDNNLLPELENAEEGGDESDEAPPTVAPTAKDRKGKRQARGSVRSIKFEDIHLILREHGTAYKELQEILKQEAAEVTSQDEVVDIDPALKKMILHSFSLNESAPATGASSQTDHLVNACNYLSAFLNNIPFLESAVLVVKLIQDFAGFCTDPAKVSTLKKSIASISADLLSFDWSDQEKPDTCINYLVNSELASSDDPLSTIEDYLVKAIPGLLDQDAEICCDFPNMNKNNLLLFYKALVAQTSSAACVGSLDVTSKVVDLFFQAVSICKSYSNAKIFAVALRHSKDFVQGFLKNALPVLTSSMAAAKEEVLSTVTQLQKGTRLLQVISNECKSLKQPLLLKYVPQLKRALETLLFEIKKMLSENNCLHAFWIGNLKQRNLKGENISSQIPVDSESSSSESEPAASVELDVEPARRRAYVESRGGNESDSGSMQFGVRGGNESDSMSTQLGTGPLAKKRRMLGVGRPTRMLLSGDSL